MRQDQYEKLQGLGEQLLDLFIVEVDSAKWPGAGVSPADMTSQQRGDRVWTKRDCAATLVLVTKMETLVQRTQSTGAGVTPSEDDDGHPDEAGQLEHAVAQAEREASRMIDRLTKRAK